MLGRTKSTGAGFDAWLLLPGPFHNLLLIGCSLVSDAR